MIIAKDLWVEVLKFLEWRDFHSLKCVSNTFMPITEETLIFRLKVENIETYCVYVLGVKHGASIRYNDFKNKIIEQNYKNGKLHGLMTNYYDDGRKKLEQNYENGIKRGPRISYLKDGRIRLE
jgi:antitoxin component YwqK of YwqJK toxin-antitoxin module